MPFFTVAYDGGRHPEYDSNAFSTVYGFGRDKNGKLYLIIEDSDEYGVDRCDSNEFVSYANEIGNNEESIIEWFNNNK